MVSTTIKTEVIFLDEGGNKKNRPEMFKPVKNGFQ